MKTVINGQVVEGTPEEIAKLLELSKSLGGQPAQRMPRWVDKTEGTPKTAKP